MLVIFRKPWHGGIVLSELLEVVFPAGSLLIVDDIPNDNAATLLNVGDSLRAKVLEVGEGHLRDDLGEHELRADDMLSLSLPPIRLVLCQQ